MKPKHGVLTSTEELVLGLGLLPHNISNDSSDKWHNGNLCHLGHGIIFTLQRPLASSIKCRKNTINPFDLIIVPKNSAPPQRFIHEWISAAD